MYILKKLHFEQMRTPTSGMQDVNIHLKKLSEPEPLNQFIFIGKTSLIHTLHTPADMTLCIFGESRSVDKINCS